ncbi:NADH:flavin oxidoreductase [Solimonas sp. K1W22B-7]|uniref:NADH:flavin oxidoreductase n=1 Tax=Solimonas sp. K1W22B-7 TaxID=2303331 RepID=UPI000E330715|nr:NADH:flavin oxidoreductase [Solimonas sp. K1W22B-7]AXQ29610.1 NADH:flavin oxidoreductase [Solimonas sp. K1W22B-7]
MDGASRIADLFAPLGFKHGPSMKNRLILAPLTNLQSHEDGSLSDDEFHWLAKRAQGGFGLTMSCAAFVQMQGRGFPGQLGVSDDRQLPGLTRLATEIRRHGSLAVVQLHHAGVRSPKDLNNGLEPVGPSDFAETGARALSHAEVEQLIEDFIAAALRAQKAGFDGVEVHGAHGYVVAQFISSEFNQREDEFGGSLENRCRVLFRIIDGIRERCGPDFSLGLRISPERFGQKMSEVIEISERLFREAKIDYLDLSLWDAFKEPIEEAYHGSSLLSWFTRLDRGAVRLGACGKIRGTREALACLQAGADFVAIGRSAILHHDFPERVRGDGEFQPVKLPVTADYLRNEGLGPKFVEYMRTWPKFVAE